MLGETVVLALRWIYQAVFRPAAEVLAYALNPSAARAIFKEPPSDDTLEARLAELAKTMGTSAALVAEIEATLTTRAAAVEKLREDAATAQRIMDITREDREALAAMYRAEVAQEGKRNLWQGAAINAFFFGLGIVVTVWIGR